MSAPPKLPRPLPRELVARWRALPEWLRGEAWLSLRVRAIVRPHVVGGAPLDLERLREVYPATWWPADAAGRLDALHEARDVSIARAREMFGRGTAQIPRD